MRGISAAFAIACIYLSAAPSARAEPARAALVVGNATYGTLPGITSCARSANAVASALRALRFEVIERQDASTGGVDAGMTEFSQHLADGATGGFLYICGYATDFNNRTFLLPITARIGRPSDVMTQGVLAKSMLGTVTRDPATVAVVVFDLVPKPDGPPKLDLDALTGIPVPDGVGVIAVSETPPADGPTPLAAALVSALAGPEVRTEALLAGLTARLAGNQAVATSVHAPTRPGFLAGAPPPPEPPRPAPVSIAPTVSAPTVSAPAVSAPAVSAPAVSAPAVSAPTASTPPEVLPDEPQMTEVERRKVQGALIRLGYYGAAIDGAFGPETRAAIRRYQHEIRDEMTGRLTSAQASRLVNSR